MVAVARKRGACEARGRRGAALRRARPKRRRRPRLAGADPGARAHIAAWNGRRRSGRPTVVLHRPSPALALTWSKRNGLRTWPPSTSRSWSIPTIRTGESRRAPTSSTPQPWLHRRGGMLIVDEAFADFGGAEETLAPALPASRAVVLRLSAGLYGLAGLRLGFASLPRTSSGRLRAALGPWPVSGRHRDQIAAATSDWLEAMRARLGDNALASTLLRGPLANHRRRAARPGRADGCARHLADLAAGILTRPFAGRRSWLDQNAATRPHGNGSPRRFGGANQIAPQLGQLAFPCALHEKALMAISRTANPIPYGRAAFPDTEPPACSTAC